MHSTGKWKIFTQFSSELDETTKKQLVYGQGLMRLLRQNQGNPLSLSDQVIMLVAAQAHVMQNVPVEKINDFRSYLLERFSNEHSDIIDTIEKEKTLSDELKEKIIEASKKILAGYNQMPM